MVRVCIYGWMPCAALVTAGLGLGQSNGLLTSILGGARSVEAEAVDETALCFFYCPRNTASRATWVKE
ncbi:uncharacterized protein ASCRUDRAFT_76329 [Ascoidea rubescens DSM 1968]|uniref:Uncharacterized protein n=1 Tax=Ascoidea rubescens DSM 1968 TaxID=1344418 RepID=A0A1D2VFD9_9ASCO|nr:hypothetical protein ASCRUDRAFT_76329 [Ascoidea rubescens DSM 1968]ODV60319.1 hypothetical protein ASCRUDRAFT_76329 [Ascoidea rubescens DSM 1968]